MELCTVCLSPRIICPLSFIAFSTFQTFCTKFIQNHADADRPVREVVAAFAFDLAADLGYARFFPTLDLPNQICPIRSAEVQGTKRDRAILTLELSSSLLVFSNRRKIQAWEPLWLNWALQLLFVSWCARDARSPATELEWRSSR